MPASLRDNPEEFYKAFDQVMKPIKEGRKKRKVTTRTRITRNLLGDKSCQNSQKES
jgi:hypothetical protein